MRKRIGSSRPFESRIAHDRTRVSPILTNSGSHNWKRQFLTGFTHYSLSRIESGIVGKWIAEDHDGPVSTP